MAPAPQTSSNNPANARPYALRPSYKQKPNVKTMKSVITQVMSSKLQGKVYEVDGASQWTKEVADEVKNKLKALEYPRYKYVVQAVIAEQRGEGIYMGTRCFWDQDCDVFATENYISDGLFCVVGAYAVYLP